MSKKNVRCICVILMIGAVVLLLLLFPRISKRVSEPAQAVMTAMFTAPDDSKIDDTVWPLNGPALTEQERMEMEARTKAVLHNWEAAVGSYFCDGGLNNFLLSGPGLRFHLIAKDRGVKSSLSSMALLEKTDRYESVLATVLIGSTFHDIHVTFRYNPDGKIYKVVVDEDINGLFEEAEACV